MFLALSLLKGGFSRFLIALTNKRLGKGLICLFETGQLSGYPINHCFAKTTNIYYLFFIVFI